VPYPSAPVLAADGWDGRGIDLRAQGAGQLVSSVRDDVRLVVAPGAAHAMPSVGCRAHSHTPHGFQESALIRQIDVQSTMGTVQYRRIFSCSSQ
jgi:hypothetical protein